jgi:ribA/ribD-fused uncharacterized protein
MINKFEGRFRFLSNFYPCEIEHQGIKYKTVENFYVAMKVNDQQLINGVYYTPGDFREMVSKIINPGFAKKIGEKVKLRKDWSDKKLEYMNWAVREKFKNEELSNLLISTGDSILIEYNNWHDNYWGQCLCSKCKDNGKNHLGKILMKIRDELNGKSIKGLDDFFKNK